ncbi:uncharacterized protein [Primulina eburnea]|uniref:uncharacterized protein n=1 Tax=Primulina eburnea TaxID=1245227 RepID=UPI003C6C0370
MSKNPEFPAKKSSPANSTSFSTTDIPLESSRHCEPSVQISSQSELICPPDLPAKVPTALFLREASTVSSIPASSGNVSSSPAPIWNPCSNASSMVQVPFSNSSSSTGNFRSTVGIAETLAPSSSIVEFSGVACSKSNSSSQYHPQIMGNIMVPSISEKDLGIKNAQIGDFQASSSPILDRVATVPAGSGSLSAGFMFSTPSPALGKSPTGDSRVDSVELLGGSMRVDSAVHRVRSPVPVASKVSGRSVPPTVSFRDILRRSSPPSPDQSFADVVDSMDEVPAPTDRDGIPGILFPDQVISSLSAPFRFALIGRISGNRGLTPNKDILSALSCVGLLGSHTVRFLPRGYMVLTLSCEEDYLKFWERPEISIRSVVIRFSKWTPEFIYEEDSSVAPVWGFLC